MLTATQAMIDTILESPEDRLSTVWSSISARVLSSISTSTALKAKRQFGFVFGGLIESGLAGQRKSAIYYVFDRKGTTMCSKVYYAGHEAGYEKEVQNLLALKNCRNTIQLIANFNLGENFAIIFPLYGLSLHSYGEAVSFSFDEEVALRIVRDVLLALQDIHARNYCFVDVKTRISVWSLENLDVF
jgi:serine/threonine protein kinase